LWELLSDDLAKTGGIDRLSVAVLTEIHVMHVDGITGDTYTLDQLVVVFQPASFLMSIT
jgi:hypothetical protein